MVLESTSSVYDAFDVISHGELDEPFTERSV
jgi:hypothetical protein